MIGRAIACLLCLAAYAWFALPGPASAAPVPSAAISFNRYHDYQDVVNYLHQVAAANPSLVQFKSLHEAAGDDIPYLVIGKDPGKPAIYLNGAHHGNERASTEVVLGVVGYFLAHQREATIGQFLSEYILYLQPVVNTQGFLLDSRWDAEGNDPNRDYAYPGEPGGEAFHLPTIQAVRGLLDHVRFRAAIAYHAGIEGVLFPWCYADLPAKDYDLFYTLSKRAARAMGMRKFIQSYFDYPSRGEFIDYAYMRYHTLAVTFEVAPEGAPSAVALPTVVARGIKGTLAYLSGIEALDHGNLLVEHGPRRSEASLASTHH